jgi:hypothetical protein
MARSRLVVCGTLRADWVELHDLIRRHSAATRAMQADKTPSPILNALPERPRRRARDPQFVDCRAMPGSRNAVQPLSVAGRPCHATAKRFDSEFSADLTVDGGCRDVQRFNRRQKQSASGHLRRRQSGGVGELGNGVLVIMPLSGFFINALIMRS